MSLVEQALKQHGRPRGSPVIEEVTPERVTIGTKEDLVRIALDEMASERLPEEERQRCASHRTFLTSWSCAVQTRIGHVDEDTWRFQVRAAIAGAIDNHTSSQPNGRWKLADFDAAFDERLHTREVYIKGSQDPMTGVVKTERIAQKRGYLVVALKLVDILGARDIEYHLGKPVAIQTASAGVDPELLAKFAAAFERLDGDNRASALAAENEELRARLDRMEAMLARLTDGKAEPKRGAKSDG